MNTNLAGAIAVHKVCSDLLSKGHCPYLPTGEFVSPCDMVVITNDGKVVRLQIKHAGTGQLYNQRQFYAGREKYTSDDFDYFAVYLPDVDAVIYPSIAYGGKMISSVIPKTHGKFWWYKDFLDFTNTAVQRTGAEMGADMSFKSAPRHTARKVVRPSPEILKEELWACPTTQLAKQYGVSDNAIGRWAKEYGIDKPPRGYWMKNKVC